MSKRPPTTDVPDQLGLLRDLFDELRDLSDDKESDDEPYSPSYREHEDSLEPSVKPFFSRGSDSSVERLSQILDEFSRSRASQEDTPGVVSCAGDSSSSGTAGSSSPDSTNATQLSTASHSNSNIGNKRGRDKQDDWQDEDGERRPNQRRSQEADVATSSDNKYCERIQCISEGCRGLTPSISEWLYALHPWLFCDEADNFDRRKLESCHGIFLCSRCWQTKGATRLEARDHQCFESLCVCTKGQPALENGLGLPPVSHRKTPHSCEEGKKALKEAQYSYICRLLRVPEREFVFSKKVWHTNEKSRKTERSRKEIEQDIATLLQRSQQSYADIEKQLATARQEIKKLRSNAKGCEVVILQFAERLCEHRNAVGVPRSCRMLIAEHAPDILEVVDGLKPAPPLQCQPPPPHIIPNAPQGQQQQPQADGLADMDWQNLDFDDFLNG
ncbi:uncharacterized protein LTR77_005328 [Saxophila tyrrhenica]|uniref:Uncharacterized protein n=1 Tax=Saxophila tyrrhenica TaxID=1690608 RepID=A0AAV9P8Z4_9PEZI|nr:hypothetical protein LTR77_005328 [Saxophila tyrrhenica]